ncbi:MAG: UDP-N-acetylmuramoyl-L-alanine--D-glutamate ligase, partial [Gemmatimonadota bacterium]
VELAFRYLESRLIAITGTNGKTTTTRLCGHVMAAAEWSALTAGNVGRPLSEVALLDEQPDWVVAELSSFQLADCERFLPDIGVVLNLAPDHLDRYASVESYYADKRRLFDRATPDSRWIVNADDPDVLAMVRDVPGRVYRLSVAGPVEPGAFLSPEGDLCLNLPGRRERWLGRDELRLLGAHNVTNALAAGLAAALAGCPGEAIAAGLRSFEGLPHRLRPVTELGGVLWVNDSKATNCSATRVALRAFDRKIVLLLGGRDKGEPYASLIPDLRGRLRGVVAFGEAAPKIVADLKDAVPELRVAGGMEALVRAAADMARPGDVVLFSPACSSYDMFPNYKERGWALERRIRDLCRECAPAEASRRADEASEGFTGEGRE